MRAIFFGTPEFAVPSLEAVHARAEVVAVFCQPDRRSGRGMKLQAPPVKARALELGLTVHQPTKVRTDAFAAQLRALEADVAVVVAYGRILPRAVLDAPRRGCINVHASLLPRWRGAAPIQWAVVHGDRATGISLMQMDEGMDTGPVFARCETQIDPDETAGELALRLAPLGAQLLGESLAPWVAAKLVPEPQDEARATAAPLLTKEDGRIDWLATAWQVHDRVRGMAPWPGAFTEVEGEPIKIHRTKVVSGTGPAGTLLDLSSEAIVVACGEGAVAILELQQQGRRRLNARDFLAGHEWKAGMRLRDGGAGT